MRLLRMVRPDRHDADKSKAEERHREFRERQIAHSEKVNAWLEEEEDRQIQELKVRLERVKRQLNEISKQKSD